MWCVMLDPGGQRVLRDAARGRGLSVGADQNRPTVLPFASMSTPVKFGVLPEAGHPLHVAAEHDDEAGAGARHDPADREPEPAGTVQQQGVVAEREMGLRHAHGDGAEAELVHPREVLLGLRQVVDPVGAVEPRRDRLDLAAQGRAVGRELVEVVRRSAHVATTASASSIAPSPPSANPRFTTTVFAPAPRPPARRSARSRRAVSVGNVVDRDHAGQAVGAR